jgi:hypothetical protein
MQSVMANRFLQCTTRCGMDMMATRFDFQLHVQLNSHLFVNTSAPHILNLIRSAFVVFDSFDSIVRGRRCACCIRDIATVRHTKLFESGWSRFALVKVELSFCVAVRNPIDEIAEKQAVQWNTERYSCVCIRWRHSKIHSRSRSFVFPTKQIDFHSRFVSNEYAQTAREAVLWQ